MTKDLISNMISKLKNANLINQTYILVPYSNKVFAILKIFLEQGYINDLQILLTSEKKKQIKIFLKYKGWWIKKPTFSILTRVSKPGRRIFSGYKDFYKKLASLNLMQGLAIVSTSIGILTHLKAKKLKKGGEILCYIE